MNKPSPKIHVQRTGLTLKPDSSRVFFRPYDPPTNEQVVRILARVTALPEEQAEREAQTMLREFGERHHKLRAFLLKRFEHVRDRLITDRPLSESRKLLLGAYFTQEYALEAAALFNPSIVPDPDQSGVPEGSLRFILSLRATGEGHISSIVFRRGLVDAEGKISISPAARNATAPEVHPDPSYEKRLFERKLFELGLLDPLAQEVMDRLNATFTLSDLEAEVDRAVRVDRTLGADAHSTSHGILALARANYEICFDPEDEYSERVIFPYAPAERGGIEDARFVAFQEDDGSTTYYGTYTAFDGEVVLPQLLETRDFLRFRSSTLNGPAVQNKGMALFPRRIRGCYAMLSRQDGENLYLMYSDMLHFWYEKRLLLRPTYPWEFVKVGNCGSPIETKAGWLVITHGVGAMRKYALGAILLDRDDPSRVIGRLSEPLLVPSEKERTGYVPNVVYSCGALVHAGRLILPYGMSDQSTSFALVSLDELLDLLTAH